MSEKQVFSDLPILTDHARLRLARRGIDPKIVQQVLRKHAAVIATKNARFVLQDVVDLGDQKPYLLRIVIDADREPPEVVTAYITSKLKKYGA